jgi:hypothetical protein
MVPGQVQVKSKFKFEKDKISEKGIRVPNQFQEGKEERGTK